MIDKVHAHQILALLDSYTAPVALADFRARVTSTYGSNVIFINCHEDSFNLDQLIDFMVMRQKVTVTNGTIQLNKANVCNH